ncbi:hypothetical protein EUGRSUZ_B03533 [Eucalyptus grandis]|uniref:Uncharacterized protein n=2 Tax=Eucalyptus grandis TaxID=71139 RepID=A0ACC3LWE8_EUCGR|nr:hypothetical protein EUGRSUZ_B03533 [Eucalyptus grandis]
MDSIVKREPDEFVRTRSDRTPIYISSDDRNDGVDGGGGDDDDDDDDDDDSGCSDRSAGDGRCPRAAALGASASAPKRKKTRSLKEIDRDLALKKPKLDEEVVDFAVPVDFLAPLPPCSPVEAAVDGDRTIQARAVRRQFWKAGDYEGESNRDVLASRDVGMDRVRVHPKFLHSNATSHKWALGAFAELLDNAVDEVCNGATYVHLDLLENKRKNFIALVIEDNGGGMTPDKMRKCMSLGYSAKSKAANTIGQYGNGFKTSTMRLGADVIVFSRSGKLGGMSASQSIGMLSYTFLRATGKEDIIVPIVDYQKKGQEWSKIIRSSTEDWNRNFETILHWSPFENKEELLQQFNSLQNQGTRIMIYNLWEDDDGSLELNFDTDPHDIQIRGVNREEKKIKMAKQFPNLKHFLTYRHSLRSYASILYLRRPPDFRIILRGADVRHHSLVNDMMLSQKITYKPSNVADSVPNNSNMVASVTIGFVKDASYHIDVQGFNVYHKNRLIKPFWRVWNAAGSDGRGVIGVLEVNFIEPAHDKQDFERTIVLSKLEARLVVMQRNYWNTNCHHVGYAATQQSKKSVSSQMKGSNKSKSCSPSVGKGSGVISPCSKFKQTVNQEEASTDLDESSEERSSDEVSLANVDGQQTITCNFKIGSLGRASQTTDSIRNSDAHVSACQTDMLVRLKEENCDLRQRLKEKVGLDAMNLLHQLQVERERRKSLETKLKEGEEKIRDVDKEHTALINMFVEERTRGEQEEDELREQLMAASSEIDRLLHMLRQLQDMKVLNRKVER